VNNPFQCVWSAVNDPRPNRGQCDIVIDESFWTHNRYKHLRNRNEPWEELFGVEVAQKARNLAARREKELKENRFHDSDPNATNEVLSELCQIFEKPVTDTLLNGPVLVYRRYSGSSPKSLDKSDGDKWQLILAKGLVFAILTPAGPFPHNHRAATSYFHRRTFANPGSRFTDLVELVVTAFSATVGGQIVLPDDSHVVQQGNSTLGVGRGRFATQICFANMEAWGFDKHGVWSSTKFTEGESADAKRIKLRPRPITEGAAK